jgi:hypothetical protein
MVTYFLMIDHVLSSDPQVLARVIPTTERVQGLLGTLKVVSDCQSLPALMVLAIIESIIQSPDWHLPFEIMCDASDYIVGVVLGQSKDKKHYAISYVIRTLTRP